MTPSTRRLDRLAEDVGELLEDHGSGPDLERWSEYAADPVGFIEEVLGGEPWSRQVEVAEAVRDSPMVAVQSCNGTGKDWLAARLALWWVYARGGLVVLTGPTRQQVEEILMRREVHDAFRGSGLPGSLHVKALRPGGDGRAGIVAKTSTAASTLTGLHDKDVLFLISEAQHEGLEVAFKAAFANAVGESDRVVAYGNPLNPVGPFYNACNNADWTTVKIPASDVPNVVEGETVVPGLMTRAGVERIKGQYGEGSPYFQARVSAEFPEESEAGLFKRSWIEAAIEKVPEVPKLEPYVFGVDIARSGADKSACAVRQGMALRHVTTWRAPNTMESVDHIERLLESFTDTDSPKVSPVIVDESGIGAGVLDRLEERLKGRSFPYRRSRRRRGATITRSGTFSPAVEGFNSSRSSSDPDRYKNLRAAAYWKLRTLLEEESFSLPDDPELAEELWETRWQVTGSGQIQIEPKENIKSRLGRSPDRADALAMSLLPQLGVGKKTVRWV